VKTSTIFIVAGVFGALYLANRNPNCGCNYLTSQTPSATMWLGGTAALLGLGMASWVIDRSKF
jgi:hypothetical protein